MTELFLESLMDDDNPPMRRRASSGARDAELFISSLFFPALLLCEPYPSTALSICHRLRLRGLTHMAISSILGRDCPQYAEQAGRGVVSAVGAAAFWGHTSYSS